MIGQNSGLSGLRLTFFFKFLMTYSEDLRWRVISILYIYNAPKVVAEVFGISESTTNRWFRRFKKEGRVSIKQREEKSSRWPLEVIQFVKNFCEEHPTFYIEELKDEIHARFFIRNTSDATICRVLNFDLGLSRKLLTKRAREATPKSKQEYYDTLDRIYSYPQQLVFVDETSKDGRDAMRRYARSKKGTPAIVRVPFSRGKRISVVSGISTDGFFGFDHTEGTFTRGSFHQSFIRHILPHLQPWPLPRSIVIMDNAKIHCYPELFEIIARAGARLVFLPPYCPHLSPIELAFGWLKALIKKNFYMVFRIRPYETLRVCFDLCTKGTAKSLLNTYIHCGYGIGGLIKEVILEDASNFEEME